MVRVVSSEPHPSVVKEKICKNCGATLEYVPADVQKRTVRDYTGTADTYNYITCPACKEELFVP